MMFAHARDAGVADGVDELPEVIFKAGARLPRNPAVLILLLVHVAESRLDVRRRNAGAAPHSERALPAARRREAVHDVAEQEVQAVRLLKLVEVLRVVSE